MKLYRIQGQSRAARWQWAGTQDDAKRAAKECGGFWEPYEVPTDKPGLLGFLNRFCISDPDTPALNEETCTPTAPVEAPPATNYTAESVSIDEAWESLPLARKLHFAALAMEDARARL